MHCTTLEGTIYVSVYVNGPQLALSSMGKLSLAGEGTLLLGSSVP